MAISWRDKIEFSHEFTEEMLDFVVETIHEYARTVI